MDELIEDFLNDFARDMKNDQKQVLKNSQRLLTLRVFQWYDNLSFIYEDGLVVTL